MTTNTQNPVWLPPKNTAEVKKWPLGGIRFLIFNSEQNGFAKCIRRVGRKVLIHQELFDKFIEEQGVSTK